jgi:hypothetical protein
MKINGGAGFLFALVVKLNRRRAVDIFAGQAIAPARSKEDRPTRQGPARPSFVPASAREEMFF